MPDRAVVLVSVHAVQRRGDASNIYSALRHEAAV
jgi:hypothetical protein